MLQILVYNCYSYVAVNSIRYLLYISVTGEIIPLVVSVFSGYLY